MLQTHFQGFSYGSEPGLVILLHICRVELALFLITTYHMAAINITGVLHCRHGRDAGVICQGHLELWYLLP